MNARSRRPPALPPILRDIIEGGVRHLIERAWFNGTPQERKLRLRTITALILELERIRAVAIFATAIGEGAIVEIIEGDWNAARGTLKILSFEHEPEDLREESAPLWRTFCQVLEAAANEHDALKRGEGSN